MAQTQREEASREVTPEEVQDPFVVSVLPQCTPLPPPIRSLTPGTWAHDTMSRRVIEDIVDKVVLGDNADKLSWTARVAELRAEIARNAPLRLLEDDGGPDVPAWNALLKREDGDMTWLSAPWLLSEFYLYRRVAAATRWFSDRDDCFSVAKAKGLDAAMPTLESLFKRALSVIQDRDALETFVFISLWGNRMDLSLWPASENVAGKKGQFDAVLSDGQAHLLADHMPELSQYIINALQGESKTVDIVVDNAGFELCADLLLADHLLSSGAASRIRFRVKHHPTFVSDALEQDVDHHIAALLKEEAATALNAIGERWRQYRDDGRFECVADTYWAMPYPLWEMPPDLRSHLQQSSSLVIVKGDANYRRALGDRPWPYDAPFSQVLSYFPAPVLCLRTLKAELGCGMDPAKVQRAKHLDPNWLTNGKWGVLQFFNPEEEEEVAAS